MKHTCRRPETCGQPTTNRGRVPNGFIKTHTAGTDDSRWWCSTQCLISGLTATIVAARPDVAACPLCINRHDRGHRCGVCNTQPHIVRPAPRPVQLFDHARRDLAGTTRKETA